MNRIKILIIDDEKLIRWSLEKQLVAKGYNVQTAETGEKGIEIAQKFIPDLVYLDNHLPKMNGLDVIPALKEIDHEVTIIFMTAYGSIETAVESMKRGALEYMNKPFSLEEAILIAERVANRVQITKENKILKHNQKDTFTFESIIGQSEEIRNIKSLAAKIAKTETTTILLLGESGTGKDLFARAIHNESNRQDKPFVTINCSSLPETLLESELFGHEKGAFTDAKTLKKGLFEIAEGGTVFLDEIGEINLSSQIKLLGILENRTFRRLGGTVDIPLEIRIIAATNKDLQQSVVENTFRQDLYYRLKVFQLELPPLRKRKDDITLLAEHFIGIFNKMFAKKINEISPEFKDCIQQYDWPGNIRELRNVIERAVILETESVIDKDSLPSELLKNKGTNFDDSYIQNEDNQEMVTLTKDVKFNIPEEGFTLDDLEKAVIQQALMQTDYNQTKAAKILGISRDTLRYKQKKFDL